jgi:hypothetical protein
MFLGAGFFGVNPGRLIHNQQPRRQETPSQVRHVVFLQHQQKTRSSCFQIGGLFGGMKSKTLVSC